MYKVFFNDSTITIDSEMKKSLNDVAIEAFDECNIDVVNQIITKAEKGKDASHFWINSIACSETWNFFKTGFFEILAAGGLVRNSKGQLLFIKRLGYWDLPKGKVELQETPEISAIREVEEECGIGELKIIRALDSTFHIYRSPFLPADKNLVLKETKWYLMEYSGNQPLVPQTEEDIEEVRWLDLKDIRQVYKNTYASLREFLDKSLPII